MEVQIASNDGLGRSLLTITDDGSVTDERYRLMVIGPRRFAFSYWAMHYNQRLLSQSKQNMLNHEHYICLFIK